MRLRFDGLLGRYGAAVAAVAGVSALRLPLLRLNWLEAPYLLYMAVRMWRDRSEIVVSGQTEPLSAGRVIWSAVLLNVLNPKLTIFFIAFLPQFVSGSADPLPRMLLLSLVFMLVTFAVFALYGWVAAGLRTGKTR